MKKRLYLALVLLLAIAVTGGSFAFTATSKTVNSNVTTGSAGFASITSTKPVADWPAADKYASTPSWTPVQNTVGTVTAGHVFYIDPGDYTGDLIIQLYVTNVGDLARGYSYMNLGVNFYKVTGAAGSETWTEETAVTGALATGLGYYLTFANGYVSFVLPAGSTKGVVTIDDGSFYTISTNANYLTPKFYIDVRQA